MTISKELAKSCRHPNAWIIVSKHCKADELLWCPDCGAIRHEKWNRWLRPIGHKQAQALLAKLDKVEGK
jgi:hypothetical protein